MDTPIIKPANTSPLAAPEQGANIGYIYQYQIPPGEIKAQHLAATTTIAKGDLYYGDGNNNFTRLPIGTVGQILTVVAGVPTWV